MKKITSVICAAAMALPMMIISPASSTPVSVLDPLVQRDSGTSVVDVQYRRHRKSYRSSRRHYRPRHYRPRHHRYHRHRGNGDVAAGIIGGLAAGAIIGSMANSQSSSNNLPRNYHVEWCLNKYRSYDVRSDTFQPYNGPRKRCNSPYR